MISRKQRKVTAKQYRYALRRLGLTQAAAGRLLGVDERTSKRYAERGINSGPAVILLSLLLMKAVTPRVVAGVAARSRRGGPLQTRC